MSSKYANRALRLLITREMKTKSAVKYCYIPVLVFSDCCHRVSLGGINNRKFFSQFCNLKSKIQVLTGLVSGEASLLDFQMVITSPPCYCVFSRPFLVCVDFWCLFSSCKDTSPIGLGPHPHELI